MGFILNTLRLKFTSNNVAKNKRIEIMIMERVTIDIRANIKFMANLNFVNFENNVEVLESNAERKLLERMDNRQRNYLEYYKSNMLYKEQDKLNKYAYTEANRKVFSLNQSDEKLKRGKIYWLEYKPHIYIGTYCQNSLWYDDKKQNEKNNKKFWQIDNWENQHRQRLKLIEYKGGLIKTRSAGDSHSVISNNNLHNLTQSIANLDEWGIKLNNNDSNNNNNDDEEELSEMKEDNDNEDEWDYCNDIDIDRNNYYELEDMIIYECNDNVLLITPIGSYDGKIKITRTYFQFISSSEKEKKEKEKENNNHYTLPALNKIRNEESRDRYINLDK
eukprot:10705_1